MESLPSAPSPSNDESVPSPSESRKPKVERMLSERGGPIILVDNYKFSFQKRLADGRKRWACTKKECRAYLRSDSDGGNLELKRLEHSHPPEKEETLQKQRMWNSVKMNAVLEGMMEVGIEVEEKPEEEDIKPTIPSLISEYEDNPTTVPQGSPSSTSPVPIAPKKAAPPPPPPPQVQPPEVCLRWNSYHSNMQATFPSLLNNEQFVDVTLACEGRSIKCHKVMLSACSSYFEELLSQNPCQHPIVFMRDLKFWEVQALVEFMYSGEVNVAQEKLPSLLAAAEALQIKGLTPSTASNSSNNDDEQSGGGGDTDEGHPQPQKRVRKRKSAHPVAYPVRHQNAPPSPGGNQLSQIPMQPLQKIKVPMMSPIPGTSHHREEPSYHPPVRIKRERSSTPPLALCKEEPLDLGMDNSERNKDDSNGSAHSSSLQDAINRLHGKQHHQHSASQGSGMVKMESNGGLSEDDGSGSERSPPAQSDPGEGEV